MKALNVTTLAYSTLFATSAAFAQGNAETALLPLDPSMFARFGYSSAINANHIIVGARGAGAVGGTPGTGAAYIFDRTTGLQTGKLVSLDADPGDIFGNTVALEGDLVLVGADREDGNEDGVTFLTNSGTAYLFDATTGQQLFKLRASDPLLNANFGKSVSMGGGLAAIGSNGRNAQGTETGTTYIFDVATGQQLHKLLANDGDVQDDLGDSVSISNGIVVAGAPRDDDNGIDSGSAYVFDAQTGLQVTKLLATDGAASDSFGESVAIFGDRVVVGAMRDDDSGTNSGSAYVFDANTGQQLMKLLPADGAEFDNFGDDVAISGTRVIVSSPRDDDNGNSAGAVYVFDLATGQQIEKIVASDGQADHFFGRGLSIDGDNAVMGSPFADIAGSSSGSAYLVELDTLPGGVISYCDPVNGNSASANGALLTSTGGFGTAQATFDIVGVPNSFGILFAGDVATDVVLGCGRRCVGGNLIRGQVLMASGNQILGAGFDMSMLNATHIQYWHRDSGTCGAGMNLSNALTR